MKKINLKISTTYTSEVELEISEEQYSELRKIEEIQTSTFDNTFLEIYHPNTLDFLTENIKEKDAISWEYEIVNLEEV